LFRRPLYNLDTLARAHGIAALAGPLSLNATWPVFALAAAVILTCFTVGISALGVLSMLRAGVIAMAANAALRAYQNSLSIPDNWEFSSTVLSRFPIAMTVGSGLLVAWLCLAPKQSRRLRGPRLLSLALVAPAAAIATLFDLLPVPSLFIESIKVAGVELPLPTYSQQSTALWSALSYALLTPIVSLSTERLRALPESQ
jgi:hypothetical protein